MVFECLPDKAVLVMDGEVEIHQLQIPSGPLVPECRKAQLRLDEAAAGKEMGWR